MDQLELRVLELGQRPLQLSVGRLELRGAALYNLLEVLREGPHLVVEPGVVDGRRGLVAEGGHQAHVALGEAAAAARARHHQRPNNVVPGLEGHGQQARLDPDGVPLDHLLSHRLPALRNLRPARRVRQAHRRPGDQGPVPLVEQQRAALGPQDLRHLLHHQMKHRVEAEHRADRAPDLVQRGDLTDTRGEALFVLAEGVCHLGERPGKIADLVIGLRGDAQAQVASGDGLGAAVQARQRDRDPAAEDIGQRQGEDHAPQTAEEDRARR